MVHPSVGTVFYFCHRFLHCFALKLTRNERVFGMGVRPMVVVGGGCLGSLEEEGLACECRSLEVQESGTDVAREAVTPTTELEMCDGTRTEVEGCCSKRCSVAVDLPPSILLHSAGNPTCWSIKQVTSSQAVWAAGTADVECLRK